MPLVRILVNTSRPDLLNGTILYLGQSSKYKDSELNELLYVVIVIMFYATALMIMIATQIRKQRREGQDADYYDEYLERNRNIKDRFGKQPLLTQPPKPETRGANNGSGLEIISDENEQHLEVNSPPC